MINPSFSVTKNELSLFVFKYVIRTEPLIRPEAYSRRGAMGSESVKSMISRAQGLQGTTNAEPACGASFIKQFYMMWG